MGDRYGVTNLIGRGGMGAVYEAEHLAIGRLVAVKVLAERTAGDREATERLKHEARVAGSIGHPNICAIYDLGRLDDGSPYLVMERLYGETLAARIGRKGALPPADVLDVALQVLSALVAAHQKGIVHRDLKPENIFLARRDGMRPVPKLLDFGISKGGSADDSVSDVKGLGVPLCTPYYMSPEQARGERASDPRVDLWAVGVVLYEALSGVRPFSAKNYNALLVQVASARFEPLASLRPELNRELVRVVERALAKRLEDRYPTAQAFLDAVSSFRHDEVPPSYAVPSHRGRLESKSKVADEDSNDEATTVFKRSDVQAAARAFAIKAAAERAGGAAPLTVRSAVGRSGARASAARPERTGSHAVPKAAKASSREAQEQRRPLPKIPPAPAIPRPGKQRPLPRLYETLDDETTIVDPPSFSDTTATTKVQRGDLPPRRG